MNGPETYLLDKRLRAIDVISDESLALLHHHIRQRKLAKGQFLLTEGAICRSIYFVEKGYLRTFYNKDGKEINLNFSLENSFVTDLKSLQTALPSEFYIQAGEDAIVWEFSKQKLLDLYTQSAEITSLGRKLLEMLLLEQEEHANLFKLYNPIERYQYILEQKPQLLQRIPLSKLSSYLGISRETLSRIRKR